MCARADRTEVYARAVIRCAINRIMSTISSLGKGITGTASTGVAVHSVPCRIKVEDGVRTAAVNNYFASNVRSNDTGKFV